MNRVSLYHLETLVWIAKLGTFAAAAERLNTTQPGISARVAELENRLGAKLFRKTGRTMALTPAGRELVRDYVPIWERLQETFLKSASFDGMGGVVRLGAGEIAAVTCLPDFVADLKRAMPELAVEIDIELTATLIQGLLTGKMDIAFGAGRVAHPALTSRPIGEADLLLVAHPSLAARVSDADLRATTPAWSLPQHSPIYHVMKKTLLQLGHNPRYLNYCNNARTMIDIASKVGGFALVPRAMIASELELGKLVPILDGFKPEPMTFHVISRTGESDPVVKEVLRRATEISM